MPFGSRTLLRASAALVAVFVSGGEMVRAAHTAVVEHAVCADHGEPVHVANVAGAPEPAASGRDGAPAPTEAADDHDHCKLVVSRSRLAPPERVTGASIASGDAGAPVAVDCERPSALPILRLAPKTSPPAIG